MKIKKELSILLSLFVLLFVFVPNVFAVNDKPKVTGKPEGKLVACQAKGKSVQKRMAQLEKMATNMLEKFSEIQGRVEKYYTDKVLPEKTAANYGALITETQVKRTAVLTAIAAVKTSSAGFSCTIGDPKVQVKLFRDGMKEVKSALKNYRTSIRNLIVAVRSLGNNGNEE